MKSNSDLFERIKQFEPKQRGFAFERLLNRILQNEDILISPSYRTDDLEQQIDGAIQINGRIFLLEIKWESSKTIAASKLFSFIGKINSKIEGTLGVFISYNRLNENIISAVRNGLRQNVIIIHGETNIEEMIKRDAKWEEYIWFAFKKASINHSASAEFSEFIAQVTKSSKTKIGDDTWRDVIECIKDEAKSMIDFASILARNDGNLASYADYALEIYPHISGKSQKEKMDKLLTKIRGKNKTAFNAKLESILASDDWRQYAVEDFSDKYIKSCEFNYTTLSAITRKICSYMKSIEGNWDEENACSYIVRNVYDRLNDPDKRIVFDAFLPIFIDSNRKSKFAQKAFAEEIFTLANRRFIERAFSAYIEEGIAEAEARSFDDEDDSKAAIRYLDSLEWKAKKITNLIDSDIIDDYRRQEDA